MAKAAMAQEQLVALRQTIARLEGDQVPALAARAREPGRGGFRPMPAAGPAETGASGTGPSGARVSGMGALMAVDGDRLDAALGGGLRLDALTEIRSGRTADHGAATGLTLGLAILALSRQQQAGLPGSRILWIGEMMAGREGGLPHARGLTEFGLAPERLIHAAPRRIEEALMVAEAALAVPALAAVILEVAGNPARFGLTESRRLHVRARAFGRPLFVLRQHGEEEASSALVRFGVSPAPSALPRLPGDAAFATGIGHPAFRLAIEKSRHPVSGTLTLEWICHDHVFRPIRDEHASGQPGQQPADRLHPLSASGDGPDRPDTLGHVVAFTRAS